MALHREIITSVISRCKASSLRETFVRWGRLSSEHLSKEVFCESGTKRQLAEKLIQVIEEEELTDDIVGDLELTYMQLHSISKTWLTYCLQGNNICLNLDPRTLRSKVIHSLQLIWEDGPIFGNMKLFAGAVWLRLNLGQSMLPRKGAKIYNHNNSVFVITFPGSPYVFINQTNSRLQKAVKEAIIDAVNAVSLNDMLLTGKHVYSLADIVLGQDNKLLLRKYRDQEEVDNPLLPRQERKRKAPEDSFIDTFDMVDEDRKEKRHRRAILEDKFGSDPQVLDTLQYKFNVKFKGTPVCDEECKSFVKIKGTSVLDGLCQLAAKGLVRFPLPKHLTAVTTSMRNSFTIESARRQ